MCQTAARRQQIFSLFSFPLYTSSGVYREEDLDQLRLGETLNEWSAMEAETAVGSLRVLASASPELAVHALIALRQGGTPPRGAELERWVRELLETYDAHGLQKARKALRALREETGATAKAQSGVAFDQVSVVLQRYLQALGLGDVKLAVGSHHYTDTRSIFLPERITTFRDNATNFLLFKVMATHAFAQLELGTFDLHLPKTIVRGPRNGVQRVLLATFLRRFGDPVLARDLFQLVDAARIEAWMAASLPGLHRELAELKAGLFARRAEPTNFPPRGVLMEGLVQAFLNRAAATRGCWWSDAVERGADLLSQITWPETRPKALTDIFSRLYALFQDVPGLYVTPETVPYIGELRPEEVERVGAARLRSESAEVRGRQSAGPSETRRDREPMPEVKGVGKTGDRPPEQPERPLRPGEGRKVADATEHNSPEVAVVKPGAGLEICFTGLGICNEEEPDAMPSPSEGGGGEPHHWCDGVHRLDEWDYRRRGYRKGWVTLRELQVPVADADAAEALLALHRGQVRRIRETLESIQGKMRLVRRQRDGDHVDLDAAVEELVERRTGRCPPENAYARLERNERDIVAFFLVDLSASTRGMVNRAQRAALLILCEALQGLRDRFAIYGFSGRTRTGCELLRVKELDETYGEAVKQRIANLEPRHCTRLAPPVRHLASMMAPLEVKNRLLIILSDGKPYDCDGYSEKYGIEDTRQAILEAKQKRVVPFCITIDQEERDYLGRMYGAGSYIFVDDVARLPQRLPRIYAQLTG